MTTEVTKARVLNKWLSVPATLILLSVNECVLAFLLNRGVKIDVFDSWQSWRISLFISVLIMICVWSLTLKSKGYSITDGHWAVSYALLFCWLISLLVYIAQAFLHWQLPDLVSDYLYVGPLAGLGASLLVYVFVNR